MAFVVHSEIKGSNIDFFIQAEKHSPWVKIHDVPNDSELPNNCVSLAARDEALKRYQNLFKEQMY